MPESVLWAYVALCVIAWLCVLMEEDGRSFFAAVAVVLTVGTVVAA